jgi:hypothetical protein
MRETIFVVWWPSWVQPLDFSLIKLYLFHAPSQYNGSLTELFGWIPLNNIWSSMVQLTSSPIAISPRHNLSSFPHHIGPSQLNSWSHISPMTFTCYSMKLLEEDCHQLHFRDRSTFMINPHKITQEVPHIEFGTMVVCQRQDIRCVGPIALIISTRTGFLWLEAIPLWPTELVRIVKR